MNKQGPATSSDDIGGAVPCDRRGLFGPIRSAVTLCDAYGQPSRRMTARPITQSLSLSERNGSSSVKCVMRCW
jgi:hypothetical protein